MSQEIAGSSRKRQRRSVADRNSSSRVPDRLKFNVGGKIFETTKTTLANAASSSFFSALLNDRWNSDTDEIFIDRDPKCFGALLNLLRTGELCIPGSVTKDFFYKEALYYGLEGHLQAAVRGNLNGNLLRLSHFVSVSHAWEKGNIIRASPNGGLCVAHGNVVRTFDSWNVVGYPPICLNKDNRIYDILWCDSRNVMITTSRRDVALLNLVTGELSHCISSGIVKSSRPLIFKTLCMHSDHRNEVFSGASFEDTGESVGVEIWDPTRGKLTSSIHWTDADGYGSIRTLHWVSWMNCLLAIIHRASGDLVLLTIDPRENSCRFRFRKFLHKPVRFVEGAVDESGNNICLMDQCMNVVIFDSRNQHLNSWSVSKDACNVALSGTNSRLQSIHCYRGQLYACTRSNIFVLSGSDWVITSKVRSIGGSICDISIGGDRLFALHNDPDVINVWETPRP
ncbi:hypothetical protein CRG98_041994 [Punica granatum]|nr:hypothetical protein CRG98_041994 [Punica granatum]